MLSIEGVQNLLNDNNRNEMPFLFKWREVYYRMSLHIDGICPIFTANVNGQEVSIYRNLYTDYYDANYQYIFDAFLFGRYPTEPSETRNWRYSQYKPFTQDPFQRCIQTVMGAIFQDSGYSIKIENQEDNDYIWGNNFEGKNLPNYFVDKFQNICNDPNGIFITIPKEPRYATTTKRIEPHVFFIPSKSIKHITRDEVVFEQDNYAWCVNNIGYFRFQKDPSTKKYFHVDEKQGGYFAHMLGRVPMLVAGGIWNTQGFYESWLKAARPVADEYVIGKSDEGMVMKQASFPFITLASTDCPDCEHGKCQQCTNCHVDSGSCSCGISHENASNLALINCPSCGGSGQRSINPGDILIAPPENMDNPLVRIENIATDINKLHIERNEGIYNAMLRALHLNYIEQAQSGVAKDKDMETRYQFILKISNDLFDRLITGVITDIISLRNVRGENGTTAPIITKPVTPTLFGTNYLTYSGNTSGIVNTGNYQRNVTTDANRLFTIVKPTQFQIMTSFDLAEEYKMARESGLPVYQLNRILSDFADKRFGGDDVLQKKTHLINTWDMFSTMPYADISIVLLNNGATDRDLQFHIQLPLLIDKLVNTNGNDWFLDNSEETIRTEIDAMFTAIRPIVPKVIDENIEETRVDV